MKTSPARLVVALSLLTVGIAAQTPLYRDASAPLSRRVEDLLSRMTLEEKVGQMLQINFNQINGSGREEVELDAAQAERAIRRYHVGSFLNGIAVPAEQWHGYSDQLQRINMRVSRLGIPIIYGMDHIHGANYLKGATVFPQPINVAATFDPETARRMAEITVVETRGLGHHWIFAPVLGLARHPAWPRVYETFGEDPLLAARMGAAFTKGIREAPPGGDGHTRAACAKHFLGYSVPDSGWDRTPAEISWQAIREMLMPPFQAVIDAGVRTVMINSGEINGVPVHASKRILTDLLRGEMGFQGLAVTDWEDIIKLVEFHRVAHDEKEATLLAVEAGIDMAMTPYTYDFADHLKELVEEGAVTESRVDESVRRILRVKFDLGLFEHPYPGPIDAKAIGSPGHRRQALEAARSSIVLLRNEGGLLPLAGRARRIVAAGPSLDSKRNLSGGWTLRWLGGRPEEYPSEMMTLLDALRKEFPDAEVQPFAEVGGQGSARRSDFLSAAREADAVILALGEEPYAEGEGNINDLSLPRGQRELVAAATQASDKCVLVLIEGRPRVLPPESRSAAAVVFAGLPGFEGAQAIAEVLSGRVNPSGRLPLTYPSAPTHFVPYNHKPTDKSTAEWGFGAGLSYTSFEYSALELEAAAAGDGSIRARVTVRNSGTRAGHEAVLWFLRDHVASITRPVRELAHFDKIYLEPGESETLELRIVPGRHLTFPDGRGSLRLEPGEFSVLVGGLERSFNLGP